MHTRLHLSLRKSPVAGLLEGLWQCCKASTYNTVKFWNSLLAINTLHNLAI
jgi:hypothetical protein